MNIDSVTRSILDIINVQPKDRVKIRVEQKNDNQLHQMKVVVNRTEHEVSILYKGVSDFESELPMYDNYFTSKGAIIEKAA